MCTKFQQKHGILSPQNCTGIICENNFVLLFTTNFSPMSLHRKHSHHKLLKIPVMQINEVEFATEVEERSICHANYIIGHIFYI